MAEVSRNLAPGIERTVTFQSYATQPAIHGVFQVPLKKHRGLEGWFMEYVRLADGGVMGLPAEFAARQISFSQAVPHRVNAFHLHPKEVQDELWCVVQGALMVWLVDCREDSPTLGLRSRFVLNGEAPSFLHIPSGVAHGYKAGPEGALLVYTMNNTFNAVDPNEGRLTWDFFGAEIWEEDRG